MNSYRSLLLIGVFFSATACVTTFMPEIEESREILVVEGMITDQPETNRIRLTKSLPLDMKASLKPVSGCIVTITDDLDNLWTLKETGNGYYITDSLQFIGIIGRTYKLHIQANGNLSNTYSYESVPVELKPVPEIDDLYWERVLIEAETDESPAKEGCRIYLNTQDETQECQYFRWDYTETWEIRLPYDVPNKICWATNKSTGIMIKNTGLLSENTVSRYPLIFVSNETDRLDDKYSILVNQYSLNEEEFEYWDNMQRISEQTGNLYDITPASIKGNIYCVDDPTETVLGYFSVSSKASRRIFIEDIFSGLVNLYTDCVLATLPAGQPIPNLGTYVWVIVDGSTEKPPYMVITDKKSCADCTIRGSKIRPDFWDDDKLLK